MMCSICGGMCLDPHFTEVDLDTVLDGADGCPFHGSECVAVEFSYTKHGYAQVVFDCGAVGPKGEDEFQAAKATYKRGRTC